MLRTGTDPSTVSRLVRPGVHGKLLSDGRLGKAGVGAVCLPRCPGPTRHWPGLGGLGPQSVAPPLTKATRFRCSKVTLGRDPGNGPSDEGGLAHGPALDKLSLTPSSFLGQERIGIAWGGGVCCLPRRDW